MVSKDSSTKELAEWNDEMVKKHHKDGTLFESKNPLLRYVEKIRIKKIISMAKIKKSDSVLDLGCGEGFLLSMLPQTKKITGIDISKHALSRAKNIVENKGLKANLFFGDAQNLNVNETFDKIMCSEVLEHVPKPRTVMKNIHKILKDNGTLVVSIPDETRIQNIMVIIKSLRLDKILFAARKKEKYDWHLHHGNVKFLKDISKDYFKVINVCKTPPILRHRIVAELKKI
jgi:2-polyprenyl-3-methyl-5-hydroxy-6-metoxy-1,4-benzoquinol methylase